MSKSLVIGLVALVVGLGAAALAWRASTPPAAPEHAAAAVADAPSSSSIFPKVLNR